jgi:uncharacterized tellurite resistance protein B-like protein
MSNLEKLKFMLSMAVADGSISREELRLFSHRALEWGVSDSEFERLLDEAARDEAPLPEIPQDKAAANDLLKELVFMMAADGQIHNTERQMFAVIAAQMNVNESDLNGIIDQAIAEQS